MQQADWFCENEYIWTFHRKYKSPVNKTMATIDKADTNFALSKPNPADIDMTKVHVWRVIIMKFVEQSSILYHPFH